MLVFETYPAAEAIAGVATAGIPWGAMVADQLKLAFSLRAAKAKRAWLGNQIEGNARKGPEGGGDRRPDFHRQKQLAGSNVLQNAGVTCAGDGFNFQLWLSGCGKGF
jgi:orotate phosphoribosyltransferase